jgi:protein-L-isoaspartate O-methyltransferase
MSGLQDNHTLYAADDGRLHRMRAVLDRAGYTEVTILSLFRSTELPTARQSRRTLPLLLWRTRGGGPLNTLVRLFLLQQSVRTAETRQAVAPTPLEDWAAAGLLRLAGAEAQAAVELRPHKDLLTAADWPDTATPEPVMGVAASTQALARLTIRGRVDRALDLGTGCGVLALLAARHSDAVAAVDLNPRAVAFARFNAILNGVSNVAWHAGDWFEPVRGQAFERIVCNPPFVIGPGDGPMHTQVGRPADGLCRDLVRAAPAFLRPGGFCQLVCNWACIAGQDWRARLAGWFEGTGCDAWVLHSHTEDAADYALRRIQESEEDAGKVGVRFSEWLASYERERIEAIGFGVVTLRRSSRTPAWFRCDPLPDVRGAGGAALERGFALHDFLNDHRDDRSLLEARLRPVPGLIWDVQHEGAAVGWTATRSALRQSDGLAFNGPADRDVAAFVGRCQGERTLGELLAESAADSGREINHFAPGFLKTVRRLVELGFLEPAEAAGLSATSRPAPDS